jgi:hypothetical protein
VAPGYETTGVATGAANPYAQLLHISSTFSLMLLLKILLSLDWW